MKREEQFRRSGSVINTVELTQFFDPVRWGVDIVSAHFTKQDFPLLKEGLGFWVGRRADGVIEGPNAVLSKFGIRPKVSR